MAVAPSLFDVGPLWFYFTLREPTRIRFELYDVRGMVVRVVDPGRPFSAGGVHGLQWDGRDDWGQPLRSGIYFVRMGHVVGENERRQSFRSLARCVVVCRR